VDETDGRAESVAWDDERRLIERAKSDPQAFAPLYADYFDAVYRYALRRLGDRDRAADATSQTFLKAMAALPRFQTGSFRAWLFAIAHNVVVDTYRRSRPTARLPDAWDAPDDQPGPEQIVVLSDEAQRLNRLLSRLTPGQREVIELRLAGLSSQEIARQLGWNLAATRSVQFRAIASLRRWLDDEANGATTARGGATTRKETPDAR